MIGVRGVTDDGRPAWLLSLSKREWVVVDGDLHLLLVRERRRWWIKGMLLLVLLTALNVVFDWWFGLRSTPWAALLLAQLHLIQEQIQWRRRLRGAGELLQGGARPLDLPGEGYWRMLSFVPALLAVPVVLLNVEVAGMSPRSFLYLMILFWALVVAQIFQLRALRRLADRENAS